MRQQLKLVRNILLHQIANISIPILALLGIQTRPVGFFRCALEWSNSSKLEGEDFCQLEEPAIQDHPVSENLLRSDLAPLFKNLCIGKTTRQFRMCLVDARVYDMSGVIVHQSDRIFSELTYEYGVNQERSSFWNRVRIPDVNTRVHRIGVAHSCSADNYAHWVLEIVPQLLQLRIDLRNKLINKIYVRSKHSFQKEWLDLLGIGQSELIPAENGVHVLADELVVYSMPMRNCEFSQRQLDSFRAMIPKEILGKPKKKIFIGREGGSRSFSLIDGDLANVVESCGYEYILMERLSVKEKLAKFASASVIAGPHGGGFGGIVFCDGSTEFREIHSPLIPNLCYWRIASSMGMPYSTAYAKIALDKRQCKGIESCLEMSSQDLRRFLTEGI